MGFAIATLTLLLIFSAVPSNAQLNYEGNPLTENTEYTAEETQSVERSSRANQLQNADTVLVNNVPQKLYPVYAKDAQIASEGPVAVSNTNVTIQKSIEIDPKQLQMRTYEPRNLPDDALPFNVDANKNDLFISTSHQQQPVYFADYALSSFLHSKTPEESKVALDYYLKSRESQGTSLNEVSHPQNHQTVNSDVFQQALPYVSQNIDFQQNQNNLQYQQTQNFQPNPSVNFQPTSTPSFMSHPAPIYHSNPAPSYPSNPAASYPSNPAPNYQPEPPVQNFQYQPNPNVQPQSVQISSQSQSSYPVQPSPSISPDPVVNSVSSPHHMQTYTVQNPQESMPAMHQPKFPFKYSPPRYSRFQGRPIPRIRNKIPQQRIGPSLMYKSPSPILPQSYPPHPGMGKYKNPVEIIYTKPPGYRAPIRHAPPGPYEEASAWYPEMSRPPTSSQKDIFWSQLYTQSYDPHYYNYIAKTGKIKPHLYGKFHEHGVEDEGILSEMIKGFKKHGLKNIMNPGFLLGMTIPALTLMLTALVQKRSLARADFGPPTVDQEKLEEYMMKFQNALHMFDENKRASTTRRRR